MPNPVSVKLIIEAELTGKRSQVDHQVTSQKAKTNRVKSQRASQVMINNRAAAKAKITNSHLRMIKTVQAISHLKKTLVKTPVVVKVTKKLTAMYLFLRK